EAQVFVASQDDWTLGCATVVPREVSDPHANEPVGRKNRFAKNSDRAFFGIQMQGHWHFSVGPAVGARGEKNLEIKKESRAALFRKRGCREPARHHFESRLSIGRRKWEKQAYHSVEDEAEPMPSVRHWKKRRRNIKSAFGRSSIGRDEIKTLAEL